LGGRKEKSLPGRIVKTITQAKTCCSWGANLGRSVDCRKRESWEVDKTNGGGEKNVFEVTRGNYENIISERVVGDEVYKKKKPVRKALFALEAKTNFAGKGQNASPNKKKKNNKKNTLCWYIVCSGCLRSFINSRFDALQWVTWVEKVEKKTLKRKKKQAD